MSALAVTGRSRALLVALVLCGAPVPAKADWIFAPFLGSTFAGSTVLPDLDHEASSAHLVFGGTAGWWSRGLLGVEGELGLAPRFFEGGSNAGLVTSSTVVTVGFDVVVAAPVSVTRESLRPYVLGGVGWMHASIDESQNLFPELFGRAQNSMGLSLGGGAVGFITPRTGVRFEIRQFRSLERDTNPFTGERMPLLTFWRATVGVVIRR